MPPESALHITELLRAAQAGDTAAAGERLLAAGYDDLASLWLFSRL
jgi:hypothetical protein